MSPNKLFTLLAFLFASHNCLVGQTPQPYRDPAGTPFRRAPMAESSRSIITPLSNDLHWAFDADLLRTHTFWQGQPLNLWGPPYSGEKNHFVADYHGVALWKGPALFPWFTAENHLAAPQVSRPKNAIFKGIQTTPVSTSSVSQVTMRYSIVDESGAEIDVIESASCLEGKATAIQRTFNIAPGGSPIYLLVAAQTNSFTLDNQICRTEGGNIELHHPAGMIKWRTVRSDIPYVETIVTEAGTESTNKVVLHDAPEHRAFIEIPPRMEKVNIKLTLRPKSSVGQKESAQKSATAPKQSEVSFDLTKKKSGDAYFTIEHFALPKELELLITGMDWLGDDLLVTTWIGEVHRISGLTKNQPRTMRIAAGLNEPLGIKVIGKHIYVVQKGELTQLQLNPSTGLVERYHCVTDRWGYSGNYHSYSFGPVESRPNKVFIATAGQRSRWDMPFGGFGFEVDLASREIRPICSGLRAPNGFGKYRNELFVVDNQGNWIGACRLNHIQEGAFFGFPSSTPAPKDFQPAAAKVKPPAVWFPRKLAPSASEFVTIPEGTFGPFAGQMLVGDFQNAFVLRVALEKVKGEWQGAVWPFAKGFYSGVNRIRFGPDNKLYVGGLRRTWAAAAPQEASLDRVSFTDKVPFEVLKVRSRANAFELTFTQDLDPKAIEDVENFLVTQFTYKYHKDYGSPEFDHNGKPDSATELPVKKVSLLNPRTIHLEIEGLREKYVTSFSLEGVTSKSGEPVCHDTFYYTLNQMGE